ncbi:hypothetical protein CIK05_13655 [Bdellovibrio sp. qaytius]|nr:hypothetical protein CIK05_13655 [Bdellovibrio sp. qaytius]
MNQNENNSSEEQINIDSEADTSSGIEFDPLPKAEINAGQSIDDHHDDAVFSGAHAVGGGHSSGGSHGTEMGWLVSYADMMTLLFGLFVLLYTMSSTTSKGQMEEQMKKISEEAFGGAISATNLKETSPDEMLEKLLDKNKKLAKDLQKSQEEVDKKKDLTVTETEKKQLEQKIAELQKRMQDQQTVQTAQTQAVEEQKRQLASVSDSSSEKVQSVTLENKKIKEELDKLIQKQKELVSQMKTMVPKEAITQNPNNFLMISTTWASEKHDIDLEIIDVNNKKFNFKKKSYGGVDGQFEIDSRYGPGLEMWKTPKLQPGTYKIKVTLYNSNGNDNPAEVQANIITVTENLKLPIITLTKTDKTKEVHIKVDEKGKVTLE